MAYVIIEDDKIVGIFANPQPQLNGYSEILDDDARIEEFNQSQIAKKE